MGIVATDIERVVRRQVRLPYSIGQRLCAFTFLPAACLLIGSVLAIGIQFGGDVGLDTSVAFFAFFVAIGSPFALADVRIARTGVRSGPGRLSLRIPFSAVDRFEIGLVGQYKLTVLHGVVAVMDDGKRRKLRLSLAVPYERQAEWAARLNDAVRAWRATGDGRPVVG